MGLQESTERKRERELSERDTADREMRFALLKAKGEWLEGQREREPLLIPKSDRA